MIGLKIYYFELSFIKMSNKILKEPQTTMAKYYVPRPKSLFTCAARMNWKYDARDYLATSLYKTHLGLTTQKRQPMFHLIASPCVARIQAVDREPILPVTGPSHQSARPETPPGGRKP
jgi:hypothetical protein